MRGRGWWPWLSKLTALLLAGWKYGFLSRAVGDGVEVASEQVVENW